MQEALEKELCIDIKAKDYNSIIDIFDLAKSIQLPVVDNRKVVGILNLFDFLKNINKNPDIENLMEKNIMVAGKNRSIFSFKDSSQLILPFVDEEENFIGFVNKLIQKCYLPSEEYMQVIEKRFDDILNCHSGEIDYDKLKEEFNIILESNYDGIYITLDKGKTLSINNKCTYEEVTLNNFPYKTNSNMYIPVNGTVSVIQNIQKRNEVSMSPDIISNGGFIRVINNTEDLEKLKSELEETQDLAAKYQNELEFLRWEQLKPKEIISESQQMKKIINLVNRISKVDSTVLIEGQSGVGKGVLSKYIHSTSRRKDGPFIKIDCGSIPEQLLESELFGYEKGAFTGANKCKIGLIELANNGTLFLDEIGDLPLSLQAKMLRFIQDKEIVRIGGNKTISLDIRIIAATNRNLTKMVESKKFREDLYYRLNVVPIKIPPLKERREDIKPLIENCLKSLNKKYNIIKKIDAKAMRKLVYYDWPGNVRELNNVIENLIVTTNSNIITTDDLPKNINMPKMPKISDINQTYSLKESLDILEKKLLQQAMKRANNMEEMAKILKVDRSTISRKLKKHSIKTDFQKL